MATAKRPGGLYYTATGAAVDANGDAIKGAPKQAKDTDPSQQPGAVGAQTAEERLATAVARAVLDPKGTLATKPAAAPADNDDETDDDEADGLPTLADLPDHLAGIDSPDDVKALRKSDKRKGAKPIYEARLAELEK